MIPKQNYRPEIQGLRALAVGVVVIFHSGLGVLEGGYIGVDVFFVISGYLIAGALAQEICESGEIRLVDFYTRRIRRLLPAASLILITTTLVWHQIYSPLEMKQFSSSAISASAYLSNFWFAHLATDYFADQTSPNPLLHTWSLSVEEQFYLFWPFFLIMVYKFAPSDKKYSYLMVSTVTITIFSFIVCILVTAMIQPWAHFSSFTRLWEFGAGALSAACVRNQSVVHPNLRKLGASLGLFLILGSVFIFDRGTVFPGYYAAIPVTGTALLLICVSIAETKLIYYVFANSVSRFVGDISYALYLWHWPVFVFISSAGLAGNAEWAVGGIILSTILAAITYFTLENPIRFNKILRKKPSISYAMGISLIIASLGIGFCLRQNAIIGLEQPEQKRFAEYKNALTQIYGKDCHLPFAGISATGCEFGTSEAEETIVLFGDSHAAHWFPPLKAIAEAQSWRLVVFTKSSCPSAIFEPFASHLGRKYFECTEWRQNVFARIHELRPTKILLSNSVHYTKHESISGEQWDAALQMSVTELRSDGTELYIMRDTPLLDFDAVTCMSRAVWHRKNPSQLCKYNLSDSTNPQINDAEVSVISRNLSTHRVDLLDEICSTEVCAVQRDGEIIFSDSNHLTVEFTSSLQQQLYKQLLQDDE